MMLLPRLPFLRVSTVSLGAPSIKGTSSHPAQVQRVPVLSWGLAQFTEGLKRRLGQNLYSIKERATVWHVLEVVLGPKERQSSWDE